MVFKFSILNYIIITLLKRSVCFIFVTNYMIGVSKYNIIFILCEHWMMNVLCGISNRFGIKA